MNARPIDRFNFWLWLLIDVYALVYLASVLRGSATA